MKRSAGIGSTVCVLAAFPLGGYVKMVDEREGEVAPAELPRAFNRQPVHKRFAIVLAGPVANFILAVFVYWLLFMHGLPGARPVIDAPLTGTPAAVAFHGGETIVSVAGKPVRTWEEVRLALLKAAVARHSVEVDVRDDDGALQVHTLDLSGMEPDKVNSDFLDAVGLQPLKGGPKPVVETVVAGGAAERAGVRAGSRRLSRDQRDWPAVCEHVHAGRKRQLERNRCAVIGAAQTVDQPWRGVLQARMCFVNPVPGEIRNGDGRHVQPGRHLEGKWWNISHDDLDVIVLERVRFCIDPSVERRIEVDRLPNRRLVIMRHAGGLNDPGVTWAGPQLV